MVFGCRGSGLLVSWFDYLLWGSAVRVSGILIAFRARGRCMCFCLGLGVFRFGFDLMGGTGSVHLFDCDLLLLGLVSVPFTVWG